MSQIADLSVQELLSMHAAIGRELRTRDILRSANTPTGDYAEYLFCKAYGWEQENNSKKGYDAVSDGKRYQIKARRLTNKTTSRQLSAIRNIDGQQFDFIAGVLFDEDYCVLKAIIIPAQIVKKHGVHNIHTNSHRFHLRDTLWALPEIEDATERLQKEAKKS